MLPAKWKPGRHFDQQNRPTQAGTFHMWYHSKKVEKSVVKYQWQNEEYYGKIKSRECSVLVMKSCFRSLIRTEVLNHARKSCHAKKRNTKRQGRGQHIWGRGEVHGAFFILILVHDEGQTIFDDLNHLYNAWVLQTVTKILHNRICSLSLPWLLWLTPWTN